MTRSKVFENLKTQGYEKENLKKIITVLTVLPKHIIEANIGNKYFESIWTNNIWVTEDYLPSFYDGIVSSPTELKGNLSIDQLDFFYEFGGGNSEFLEPSCQPVCKILGRDFKFEGFLVTTSEQCYNNPTSLIVFVNLESMECLVFFEERNYCGKMGELIRASLNTIQQNIPNIKLLIESDPLNIWGHSYGYSIGDTFTEQVRKMEEVLKKD